ncbi:unnamed protein product, partial [Ectocarpus sp. 8 AP-2014]
FRSLALRRWAWIRSGLSIRLTSSRDFSRTDRCGITPLANNTTKASVGQRGGRRREAGRYRWKQKGPFGGSKKSLRLMKSVFTGTKKRRRTAVLFRNKGTL